jgi:hypothetical protein
MKETWQERTKEHFNALRGRTLFHTQPRQRQRGECRGWKPSEDTLSGCATYSSKAESDAGTALKLQLTRDGSKSTWAVRCKAHPQKFPPRPSTPISQSPHSHLRQRRHVGPPDAPCPMSHSFPAQPSSPPPLHRTACNPSATYPVICTRTAAGRTFMSPP